MGGLCAVFRPHSEANFEGMEGYNEHCANQERYRNSSYYFDSVSFSRAQVDRAVADFDTEIFERGAFMGTVHRVRTGKRNVNPSPIQVGWERLRRV